MLHGACENSTQQSNDEDEHAKNHVKYPLDVRNGGVWIKEIGADMIPLLFEKNPYMLEIYPTEESRKALTVFQIYEGSGEWFDLSKKPIERDSFTFGGAESKESGYFVTDSCIACGSCLTDCPQGCIDLTDKAVIRQENCLHCGNCAAICPVGAVVKR